MSLVNERYLEYGYYSMDSDDLNASDDSFETFLTYRKELQQRILADKLITREKGEEWTDNDIDLLLDEIEIEVGEGTNRFLYDDERRLYCLYLASNVTFEVQRTAGQIYDKIVWLWTTWEAISRATGKSWWYISEQEKYERSLMVNDKDQQLKSRFRYFDRCDRVFAYINRDEGEDDADSVEESIYY